MSGCRALGVSSGRNLRVARRKRTQEVRRALLCFARATRDNEVDSWDETKKVDFVDEFETVWAPGSNWHYRLAFR